MKVRGMLEKVTEMELPGELRVGMIMRKSLDALMEDTWAASGDANVTSISHASKINCLHYWFLKSSA